MDAAALETYLHEHIPLSAAMQARVAALEPAGVTLEAPLAPNINHRETVFGGSIASLATLAAWSLVHTWLRAEGLESRVVVMSSQIDYHAPAAGAFTAHCAAPSEPEWALFTRTLTRRGRARLTLTATVSSQGVLAATLTGTFVAITLSPKLKD